MEGVPPKIKKFFIIAATLIPGSVIEGKIPFFSDDPKCCLKTTTKADQKRVLKVIRYLEDHRVDLKGIWKTLQAREKVSSLDKRMFSKYLKRLVIRCQALGEADPTLRGKARLKAGIKSLPDSKGWHRKIAATSFARVGWFLRKQDHLPGSVAIDRFVPRRS